MRKVAPILQAFGPAATKEVAQYVGATRLTMSYVMGLTAVDLHGSLRKKPGVEESM